jgi:hypothetical protein
MFDKFFEAINITVVLRELNYKANNLATSVVAFSPSILDHLSYFIKFMHRLAIHNNRK